MTVLRYIVTIYIAYLCGSVSFSIMISTLFHKVDIRKRGSGNAGATNMARSFGLGAGLGTLFGDMVKAAIALLAGYFILGVIGMCIAGCACLLGHCWPLFYDFRGGKGISVGVVIALSISWKLLAIIAAVFFLVAVLTRKVSAGSIAAALTMGVLGFFMPVPLSLQLLSLFASILVLIRHIPNMIRLVKGEEPDFRLPSSKK
ncbi:MAG: glycerol-3-phosphate acyltransferase [Oscillospiraceae bacterium]|nr:glycerol-3-phosphate acyltransferase [Oscillospiraceae bacterium]